MQPFGIRHPALGILLCAICALDVESLTAAELRLQWKDNSDNEAGFAIERAPGSAEPLVWAEVARVGPNVQTWTDTALPNDTLYSYRVRAWNAGGFSGYSNTASARTVVAPPAAPGDATVVTVTVVVTVTPGQQPTATVATAP